MPTVYEFTISNLRIAKLAGTGKRKGQGPGAASKQGTSRKASGLVRRCCARGRRTARHMASEPASEHSLTSISGSSHSSRSSIAEWSGKIAAAFDNAIDTVIPDPAFIIDNKLTRGVVKAPRSLYKGTANRLGLREPGASKQGVTIPPPQNLTDEPSDASKGIDSEHSAAEAPSSAAEPQAGSTPSRQDKPEATLVEPGVTYDFGFGTLLYEEHPQLTLPRVVVRGAKKPIDDAGLHRVLSAMSAILDRERPFTIVYDVRSCSMPSGKQVKIGQKWGKVNNKRLNRLLQGIAIILSGVIVRSTIQMLLGICQPPQPYGIFAEEEEAFAFARDHCTTVQVFSKKKRKADAAAGDFPAPAPVSKRATTNSQGGSAGPVPSGHSGQDDATMGTMSGSSSPKVNSSMARVRVQMSALQNEKAALARDSGRAMMARLAAIEDRRKTDQRQAHALEAMQAVQLPKASRYSLLMTHISTCGGRVCGRGNDSAARVDLPAAGAPKQLELAR